MLTSALFLGACSVSLNSQVADSTGPSEPKLGVGVTENSSQTPRARTNTGATAAQTQNNPRVGATSAADHFVAASKPGNTAYKIGPSDVIEIAVFKVPELSKQVQVSDTGTVNLPLIGEMAVAGKTAQQAERDL